MPEWVGITQHVDTLDELKPYALLFDRLFVRRIFERHLLPSNAPGQNSSALEIERREAEFQYLNRTKVIEIGPEYLDRPLCCPPREPDLEIYAREQRQRFHSFLGSKTEEFVRAYAYDFARAFAILYSARSDQRAVCITSAVKCHPQEPVPNFAERLRRELSLDIPDAMQVGSVVNLVVPRLPKPNDSTPWERIIEFRNDPDAKAPLLSLRRWIRKSVQTIDSLKEIAEELEYLIEEYRSFLRLHEIKSRAGLLEVIVTSGGEIAENLVKLRFGELAKLPFKMRQQELKLLEAERNAPGHEISYIVKANRAVSEAE